MGKVKKILASLGIAGALTLGYNFKDEMKDLYIYYYAPSIEEKDIGWIRHARKVNLRKGPGTNFPVITTINSRTRLEILGDAKSSSGNKWFKVDYNGTEGWISGKYFEQIDKDIIPIAYWFELGKLYYNQEKYLEAVEAWKRYTIENLLISDYVWDYEKNWNLYTSAIEKLPEPRREKEKEIAVLAKELHSLDRYVHRLAVEGLLERRIRRFVNKRKMENRLIEKTAKKIEDILYGRGSPEYKWRKIKRISDLVDEKIAKVALHSVRIWDSERGEETPFDDYIMESITKSLKSSIKDVYSVSQKIEKVDINSVFKILENPDIFEPEIKNSINKMANNIINQLFEEHEKNRILNTRFGRDPFGTAVEIMTGKTNLFDILNEGLYGNRKPREKAKESFIPEGIMIDPYTGEPVE